MAYFTQKILNPTTSAAVSETFGLTVEETAMTIFCTGLQDDETATLQYQDAFDNQWYDVQVLVNPTTTIIPVFSATSNYISIQNDWGVYRFNKEATANPVGIFIRKFLNYNQGS